jgi:CopG family transcriptional regulator, nickel-responsive regulator
MSNLSRISISLETDLLERFMRFCADGSFATRSEAVRQLIHERLIVAGATDAATVVATLTLLYDYQRRGLVDEMLELRRKHMDLVGATLQQVITDGLCLDVTVLRGSTAAVRQAAGEISGLKGIQRAQLVIAFAEGLSEEGWKNVGTEAIEDVLSQTLGSEA